MSTFYDWAFKDGGDDYFTLPLSPLLELDSFWRDSAIEVGAAVMHLAREMGRKFDPASFRPTTAEIAALLGRSCSFVQKGLYALDIKLEILGRTRKHGGRFLDWVRGLKPALGSKKASAPAGPPSTPPEKTIPTTTTRGPSSSSLEIAPKKTDGPDPGLVRSLFERACRLFEEGTVRYGAVEAAIAVYSADWVRRMLDVIEKRNRKPGNVRKPWGYGLGYLKAWKDEGGPPDEPAPPVKSAPAPAKKIEAAPGPVIPLSADQVAELVAECQAGPPTLQRFARVRIKLAIGSGEIPAELVDSIPPHLRE